MIDSLSRQLKTLIDRNGETYTFKRAAENEFREKSGDPEDIATLKGVLTQGSLPFIQIATDDSASVRTGVQTFIYSINADADTVAQDDLVTVNTKVYRVIGTDLIKGVLRKISIEAQI